MSIIVKGMKMPENCWECVETDLNIAISVFGGMCPFCEKIRTDHDMQTGRHPECPLGALPDHHGRLGDLDALCEDLLERWSVAETRKEELIKAVMADVVTPIIACQPTIVEAEDEP